jgi:predicted DNA-binding transcriptional regulator AlpA
MQRSQTPETASAHSPAPVERLIRLNEVLTYTGEARTTCYDNIAAGIHPAPLKDGRASLWKLSEVHAYVAQKIARLPRKG